jgi:hypothetical protein
MTATKAMIAVLALGVTLGGRHPRVGGECPGFGECRGPARYERAGPRR